MHSTSPANFALHTKPEGGRGEKPRGPVGGDPTTPYIMQGLKTFATLKGTVKVWADPLMKRRGMAVRMNGELVAVIW